VNDILRYCKSPMLQTHIMYKANLSYSTLKVYLDMLVNADLLKMGVDDESSSRNFTTTPRGLKFLEQTQVLNDLLGEISEPL
jgi:predicted transcriptional regulator